jgi:hypothetical protein
LHALRGVERLAGVGFTEEGEREMDLVARRRRPARVARNLVGPLRERMGRFRRRLQREEQPH